jgi:DNA-binding SARP family transcriptional activator/class 3 adenylate cyclase/tetratricopeptide (TPR) repeat protein
MVLGVMVVEYRVLGPLEVVGPDGPVALGSVQQRAVLAALLVHAPEVVSVDRLIDELWGERPPATAAHAVQVHVSAIRKTLRTAGAGGGIGVTRSGSGYAIEVDPERVDATRFERLVAGAQRALPDAPAAARDGFEEALGLWRGRPLAEFEFAFAGRERERLEELRAVALEGVVEARLACGENREVIGTVTRLVESNPLREGPRRLLMLALYRAGRHAEALAVYRDTCQALDEIGLQPGPELRQLEQAILRHDESLRTAGGAEDTGSGQGNMRADGSAPAAGRDPGVPAVSHPPDAETRNPTALTELRLASVMDVDLAGFVTLAEPLTPDDEADLLRRYFESARTVVDRYGGRIHSLAGDAMMAVWGVPSAHEDDAERAVRAALEIVDTAGAFGEQVGARGLRGRAGVVTGQVAAVENPAGEVLVAGEPVNAAARVPSAADPGAVLVDEVTRELTAAAIVFEDAGEQSVVGRAGRLRLSRAVRVVALVGGAQREQLLESSFVGRDADLRLLNASFHGALERRSARLVAVSGEAGIGKSRLRWEFMKYTDGLADRFLWHSGRCPPFGDGVAYWPLVEMVRQRLGIPEDASAADASRKLLEGLQRWVGDATQREFLGPRLGALLGVAELGLSRAELFAGWRLFFEQLATHEPVVLVFEDLQWADEGMLDFIEHLLEWSAKSPIFILTLARPDLEARRGGWPAVHRATTQIQLDPLADWAIGDLLDELVDGLPRAARKRIIIRAQGVPLYVTETVRMLASQDVLRERDGRFVLAGELRELDVPASLSSLLAARLDALTPAERAFVRAMSVIGGPFSRTTAVALGGLPESEVDDVLSTLVRKQVFMIRADPLSPDRGQYTFAQGLLRQIAYGMLSRRERKPRHLAAAEHLRRLFANDGEDVAEMIAAHYLEAWRAATGDADLERLRSDTVSALCRAARRAVTVGAPEAAERAYRTARELERDEVQRVSLTHEAGRMAWKSGRCEAALELLEEASAAHIAAGRTLDAARTAIDVGTAMCRLGQSGEAADRLAEAVEVLAAEPRLEEESASANLWLGLALFSISDYDGAGAATDIALAIAQAHILPIVWSQALDTKGLICQMTGQIDQARREFEAGVEIATRHDLTDLAARLLGNAGNLAYLWDLPGAASRFEAVIEADRRRGDRYLEGLSVSNLMAVHVLTGHWHEADRIAAEFLDDDDERAGAEFVHYPLAILLALRGDRDAAKARLDRIAAWESAGAAELRAVHRAATICLTLAEGGSEEALQQGWSLLSGAIDAFGIAHDAVRQAWPDTLEAAIQSGHLERAHGVLSLLSGRPKKDIPPYLLAHLLRGQALVAAAEDRHDAVENDLRASIDGFRDLGYRYWLAVTQTDLAAWLGSRGRRGEAATPLTEAIEALQAIDAGPALARAQAQIRAVTTPPASEVVGVVSDSGGSPLRSRADTA